MPWGDEQISLCDMKLIGKLMKTFFILQLANDRASLLCLLIIAPREWRKICLKCVFSRCLLRLFTLFFVISCEREKNFYFIKWLHPHFIQKMCRRNMCGTKKENFILKKTPNYKHTHLNDCYCLLACLPCSLEKRKLFPVQKYIFFRIDRFVDDI